MAAGENLHEAVAEEENQGQETPEKRKSAQVETEGFNYLLQMPLWNLTEEKVRN